MMAYLPKLVYIQSRTQQVMDIDHLDHDSSPAGSQPGLPS